MKEALKLALEAVERYQIKRQDFDTFEEVITAIKAALAQPTSGDYALGYAEGFNDACKPAQPAQEPVSVTYKEVADAMNSLWNGTLEQHQIAEQMANKKLYTTPQQRPWVGLTEAQFLEATRLAENGNYLVAFVRIQAWLKEGNA